MDYQALAELLFPQIDKTPADWELAYPPRSLPAGAPVTRLGPSPTGFIHLGNLYGAFVDERIAHLGEGVFYLRIEDTDEKRFVEGAVETVLDSLAYFGIAFDEGATRVGERGDYGPYHQSARAEVYQTFVKHLVAEGKAYPCFLTEEEIGAIRAQQEADKRTPGIYGAYASCRDLSLGEVKARLAAGTPYVVRLRSQGSAPSGEENASVEQIVVQDAIRGELKMPANFQDVVILKAGGLSTYHFAHVVDDHLMRTTHVVRGEEWLSSLPIHYELFAALGWDLPLYCHTAVLMKVDENGNKRKLSKRKDPELALDYYRELGYHPRAVREYLLTILNSDYEEWRTAHPETPCEEFPFALEKMSISGALFDIDKLNDVSKDVLVRLPATAPEGEEDAAALYPFLRAWTETYRPQDAHLLADEEYIGRILNLGRFDRDGSPAAKPRKDFVCASQMFDFISYFFDEYFQVEDALPAEAQGEDARRILEGYLATYDHGDDQPTWFEKIRALATELGYAAKPKDYKKAPDDYKGHVGHVSGVIRLAVVGRSNSPDVWEIQQILGEERTRRRVADFLKGL